ncbi:sigma-70 family RNA polymerase sigma factor, partial [Candidatus Poribacteria bacterium]|nr:sigma-70 family RNA polymerase sigma factor [Candidatus Poribacteria bacterium]
MEGFETLIAKAVAPDADIAQKHEAFGELVRRFQDMAFGCAYAVLKDFQLAEDAAQEAFITAYQNLGQLRDAKAFAGWLKRIVLTQCYRMTRGKSLSAEPLEAAHEVPSADPDPAAVAEANERRGHVLAAIGALPDKERMVTTLFYINGYSQKEIADFLETSVTTVDNRLRASRKRLKEKLKMVQDDLQQNRPSRDETFVVQVLRTMGRWPTLGELIEYYSRDDICAVIYYQSRRWKIRVKSDRKYMLEPASEKETREKLVQMVRDLAKGAPETKRIWDFLDMNLLRDRPKGTPVRYDFMVVANSRNWREGFDEMAKVFDVLDAHNVYYQIKFSGTRGPDLLIPAESFPETFCGQPLNELFDAIQDRIFRYLPMPASAETPRWGLRVAYCTNPYGLMVSLPLKRKELPNFQPWLANIHTVAVDFDWFRVPDDAVERNAAFLHTVFESEKRGVTVPAPVFEPHPVKTYTGEPPRDPAEVIASINAEDYRERANAARAALLQNIQLPREKLVS